MSTKEQEVKKQEQVISPLAMDQTYGERQFHFVFDTLINVVVNLLVSAGFTYWVNHAKTTIKLPGMKEAARPAAVQKSLGATMEKLPILSRFGAETRQEIAANMAGVFTLTAAGHLVMIPSVWLGAKIKAPFVKALDRMHYGEGAMDDPSLKLRHAAIAAEERPTLLGAVMGRMGTIFATQATAYTLGSHVNLFRAIGEKTPLKFLARFRGIDDFTSLAGDKLGGAVTDMAPGAVGKLNQKLGKDYTWSLRQLEDAKHPVSPSMPYGARKDAGAVRIGGGVAEHYGKYLVSDITYTIVTAVSIKPAINFLKKFIPGLTYKPELDADTRRILEDGGKVRVRPQSLADHGAPQAQPTREAPHIKVTDIRHQERLVAHAQPQVVV